METDNFGNFFNSLADLFNTYYFYTIAARIIFTILIITNLKISSEILNQILEKMKKLSKII